ncbi:DUF3263 domain-containing protein [Phytohabitans aurantiacus]|uniref:DUF3263 domain-containing protein n=1 Tax=Phytohabitans aurantiacus TaxID=3016789 RepID=A0ABQ5QVK9_9ACTN|nr:DUF3263 domain-containing protein [Phytohabitans aurantiacus]GLH97395.1 hypothetical protein Pa4123_26700 [Phytohabitans aurantiacus]
MKPHADAPADDDLELVESEPDSDLDTDAPAASPDPASSDPASSASASSASAEEAEAAPEPGLTEREEQILAFESKWWKHAGAKEQAIRDAFDLSATRYYQILNGLLDNPAALAHDPVVVGRLRRLRSTRARTRRR